MKARRLRSFFHYSQIAPYVKSRLPATGPRYPAISMNAATVGWLIRSTHLALHPISNLSEQSCCCNGRWQAARLGPGQPRLCGHVVCQGKPGSNRSVLTLYTRRFPRRVTGKPHRFQAIAHSFIRLLHLTLIRYRIYLAYKWLRPSPQGVTEEIR
jgi:hypothetical protein